MDKLLFIFLVLFLDLINPKNSQSQNCDLQFSNLVSNSDYISVTDFAQLKRRELKNYEAQKEALKNKLKLLLAEQISISVKSTSQSYTKDNNNSGFESTFLNEETIKTEVILSSGRFKDCLDEENRMLHLIYYIDRKQAAEGLVKNSNNKIISLNHQLENAIKNNDVIDLVEIESSYEAATNKLKQASFIYPPIQLEKSNQLIGEYNSLKSKFTSNNSSQLFNAQMVLIEKDVANENFEKALKRVNELKLIFFEKDELTEKENLIKALYQNNIEKSIEALLANKEYKNALVTFKQYCALATCSSKEQKQVETLEKEFFKSEIEQFELALKNNDLYQAQSILNNIKNLAYVDAKKYQKSIDDLQSQEIDNKIQTIRINLKNKFFSTAYQEAKRLNITYGYGDERITSIRKQTTNKIIAYNIKKEKKEEKMMFSFMLGVEANTIPLNYTYLNPYEIDFNWNMLNLNHLSAGIYKKFNYKKKYSGSYPKKSDVIGFKFRMQNVGVNKRAISDFNDVTDFIFRTPDAQILLDYSLFRFLHFAGGLGYPNLAFDWEPYYQYEAGFKFIGNHYSTQLNFRNINYFGINYYMIHTGFFLHLDFDRNFRRHQKQKIENEYK